MASTTHNSQSNFYPIFQQYQEYHINMRAKKTIKKFFHQFDMFAALPTLRVKGQAQASTPLAGILSFIFVALFAFIFCQGLIQLINKQSNQISVTQAFEKDFQQKKLQNFRFGIVFRLKVGKAQPLSREKIMSYFSINIMYRTENNDIGSILVQPCQHSHFSLLGEDTQKYFNLYHLDRALCPKQSINASITTTDKSFIAIQINKCLNQSRCAQESQIDKFYNDIIEEFNHFPVWIFFLVPFPLVDEVYPIKYYLQMKLFAATKKTGVLAFLNIDKFRISTDYSVWPIIEQPEMLEGYSLGETFYVNPQYGVGTQSMCILCLYIFFNQNVNVYNRQFNKIDNVLSYAGGLFSLIISFLAIFMNSYNEYRYELMVAENSFNFDEDGYKAKQQSFTIFRYIKYVIYDWVSVLMCFEIPWQDCQIIDQTRQQAISTMDVENLFRKLEYIEKLLWKTMDKNLMLCIALVEHEGIKQVQKKRRILQYYQQIVRHEQAASVQDALNETPRSFDYLIEVKKQNQKRKMEMEMKRKMDSKNKVNNQTLTVTDHPIITETELKNIEIDFEENQQEIMRSFMEDLNMTKFQEVCEKLSKYPVIAEQAKMCKISEQFEQIEMQLTQAFIALRYDQKKSIIEKFPIIILHRLRLRSRKMKEENLRSQMYKYTLVLNNQGNTRIINDKQSNSN